MNSRRPQAERDEDLAVTLALIQADLAAMRTAMTESAGENVLFRARVEKHMEKLDRYENFGRGGLAVIIGVCLLVGSKIGGFLQAIVNGWTGNVP